MAGRFRSQTMGNVGAQTRQWDKALHLHRGEVIPWDADFVVLHEPTGTGDLTIDHDVVIVGLPGAVLEWNLTITGNILVEIRDVEIAGNIRVPSNARVVIRDCVISADSTSPIVISTSNCLLAGLTAKRGVTAGGNMIVLDASSSNNRVIGCDTTGYGAVSDSGTGNVLVGNI